LLELKLFWGYLFFFYLAVWEGLRACYK